VRAGPEESQLRPARIGTEKTSNGIAWLRPDPGPSLRSPRRRDARVRIRRRPTCGDSPESRRLRESARAEVEDRTRSIRSKLNLGWNDARSGRQPRCGDGKGHRAVDRYLCGISAELRAHAGPLWLQQFARGVL